MSRFGIALPPSEEKDILVRIVTATQLSCNVIVIIFAKYHFVAIIC